MTRLPDWPERLARFLEEAKMVSWGDADCGKFCAEAIEHMTGQVYSTDFDEPVPGVEAAGFEEIPVRAAQRGDLVLHERGLAIVEGRYAWGPGEGGLAPIPALRCLRAWKV